MAVGAALAVLFSMMVVFAPRALAHHPVIDSYSRCLDDNTLGIVIRSRSWTNEANRAGNHDDVRLQVQLPGSSTWHEVGSGAYTPDNDRRFEVRTRGSDEIAPGVTVDSLQGQTITVRAHVMDANGSAPGVGWYDNDGNVNPANGGNTNADSSMQVTLLDCTPTPPSGWACVEGNVEFIDDATNFTGTLYPTEEEAAADPNCVPAPPSGWACVNGDVVFIDDATNFTGTLYPTEEEAGEAPGCSDASAATTFTIAGSCAVTGDVASFTISGNLGAGLTLEVAGETVDVAGPFTIEVGTAGSYAYDITVDDGYELADGSPPSTGTVAIADCTPPIAPPSGWACVGGEVEFIDDATDFDGTIYDTAEEAENADGCREEVEALVVVTVTGTCDVVNNDGVGQIEVSMSIPGGATVVVRDSQGNVEGTLDDDGVIDVAEGETYAWEAIPAEGNEFPSDFDSNGSITISTCSNPEELPFTGVEDAWMGLLAAVLLGGGALLVRFGNLNDQP